MVNLIPTKEEWNKALSERHGEAVQKKYIAATVAICGLGGLGSNIAVALARAGVGRLILIDIVNIGLHFFLKNVRPYATSCSEA